MKLATTMVSLNLQPAQGFKANSTDSSLEIGACTHPGRIRENNEDCFLVAPDINLFLVSDGMGGLACGEIASRLTVDSVLEYCCKPEAGAMPTTQRAEGLSEPSRRLAYAVRMANQIVHRTASEHAMHPGMGATVVALQCSGERLSIVHVGDSRAYRLRKDDLQQLTQDHSFVAEQMRMGHMGMAEASASNLRHMLTRAVGVEPDVDVEIDEETLLEGDTLMLCSDGLTRDLSDRQIAMVLGEAENAQQAATQLVTLANEIGGGDNITVVVVRQMPKMPKMLSRIGRLSRWLSGLGS